MRACKRHAAVGNLNSPVTICVWPYRISAAIRENFPLNANNTGRSRRRHRHCSNTHSMRSHYISAALSVCFRPRRVQCVHAVSTAFCSTRAYTVEPFLIRSSGDRFRTAECRTGNRVTREKPFKLWHKKKKWCVVWILEFILHTVVRHSLRITIDFGSFHVFRT